MKSLFNLIFLFFGAFWGALSVFFIQFILARNVTPDILGNYSAILFLITTLSPLCGFGIPQYLLRIFGQYGYYGQHWVKPALLFVVYSTLIVFGVLILTSIFFYGNAQLKIAAFVMSFIVLSEVSINIVSTVFQLEEKYKKLAIWQLSQNFLRFVAILVLVYILPFPIDEKNIALCYLLVTLFIVFAGYSTIWNFKNGRFYLAGHSKENKFDKKITVNLFNIFKEAIPFGCAGLFYSIYFQLGVVFVRYYVDATTAGYYSVAFVILTAAMVFPGVVYQKFLLPKFHRWAYHDRKRFYQVYCVGNYAMLAIGIVTCSIIWWLSPIIIPLIFGDAYIDSISITQLLSLNIPIVYLASNIGAVLVTGEHMFTKVKFMGITASISLFLNMLLTPRYGVVSVIYISLLCNFILLIMYFCKVKTCVFLR